MRKVLPLVATLLLGAGPASADTAEQANAKPATPLGLAGALEVAVRQNPTLARASIDISVAEAAVLESLGIDDWVLTGTGSWSSTRRELIEGNALQFPAVDTFAVSTGISRALSSGGTIGITVDGSHTSTDTAVLQLDGSFEEFSSGALSVGASVSVFQPLLRGRGEHIARAGQRLTKIQKDAATLARETVALEVVKAIVDAYWEIAYAAKEIEIRRGSLELANEQLRITNAGIEAGATAPLAGLPFEQGILVREEAILVAEVTLSNLSLVLRRLVGLEVGPGAIDIDATEPLTANDRSFDLDATIARALERNPTLAFLALSGETARIEVEITENGLKPRLDLSASAGPDGSSTDKSEALKQFAKFESYSIGASLTYTQELGQRGAQGAAERARQSARRITIDLEEARRNIAADVAAAVNEVRAAKRRIEVSEKSIGLAEKNLVNEHARHDAGKATNFDILRRQDEIEQARLTYSRAIVDHRKAVAKVDALTGDLLERNGIAIEAENR